MEYRQLGGSVLKVPALSFDAPPSAAERILPRLGSTDVQEARRL